MGSYKDHWPIPISSAARLYAAQGFGALAIHRQLVEEFGEFEAPSLSSVKRRMSKLRSDGFSGELWTHEQSSPADAKLILEVMASLMTRARRRPIITRDLGMWISRVRNLTPDLDVLEAYRVAAGLAEIAASSDELRLPKLALDLYLAFAAWQGGESLLAYRQALVNARLEDLRIDLMMMWMPGAGSPLVVS